MTFRLRVEEPSSSRCHLGLFGCSRQPARPASVFLTCRVTAGGMTKGMTRPTVGASRAGFSRTVTREGTTAVEWPSWQTPRGHSRSTVPAPTPRLTPESFEQTVSSAESRALSTEQPTAIDPPPNPCRVPTARDRPGEALSVGRCWFRSPRR
jgi:hypothetical protein